MAEALRLKSGIEKRRKAIACTKEKKRYQVAKKRIARTKGWEKGKKKVRSIF